MTSSVAVFEAAMWVKSTHLKKLSKNQKRKYRNKRNFYENLRLKDCFKMEFTAFKGEVTPEEALTSFTISDAYRLFAEKA